MGVAVLPDAPPRDETATNATMLTRATMESRIISIDEANRMLPLLRHIVEDITANWEKIIFKRAQLERTEKGHGTLETAASREGRDHSVQALKCELNQLIDKINSYIREVEELGCFVEEFKRGIVNFPSLYCGRKVFLCWKPDESMVAHWHELDETFNDRVPIRDVRDFLYRSPICEKRG